MCGIVGYVGNKNVARSIRGQVHWMRTRSLAQSRARWRRVIHDRLSASIRRKLRNLIALEIADEKIAGAIDSDSQLTAQIERIGQVLLTSGARAASRDFDDLIQVVVRNVEIARAVLRHSLRELES